MTRSFQNGVSPSSSYAGTRDANLRENSPTQAGGSELEVEYDGDTTYVVGLLSFDLSSIPPGSVVQSATLTGVVQDTSGRVYPAYAMSTSWTEDEASWSRPRASGSWVNGSFSSADFASDVILSVSGTDTTGPKTWSFNTRGLAVIQSWVNTPSSNRGLVISDPGGINGGSFYASEHSTPTNRPKLTVTFIPP